MSGVVRSRRTGDTHGFGVRVAEAAGVLQDVSGIGGQDHYLARATVGPVPIQSRPQATAVVIDTTRWLLPISLSP